jgi:transcriptional regulator with XRE-family HTH domain
MDTDTATPGARLRAWRLGQEPRLTLAAAAAKVGVAHPTWIDWENGNRSPSLEKALAIELVTSGEIPVGAWGFDAQLVVDVADARAARALAATGS